jgi:hypothetical protein
LKLPFALNVNRIRRTKLCALFSEFLLAARIAARTPWNHQIEITSTPHCFASVKPLPCVTAYRKQTRAALKRGN